MQVSTNTFFRRHAEALADLKTESAKLQQQLATGKQVSAPSDDSMSFSELSGVKARLARVTQYQGAVSAAQQRLSVEENALRQATNVLTRIRELTQQASNDTQNPGDRKAIGKEVASLAETLTQFANAQDADGAYIFAGFSNQAPPFARLGDGSTAYRGDDGRIEIAVEDGASLAVNQSGQAAFMSVRKPDGGTASVFDIVKATVDALAAGGSPAALSGDLAAAFEHVTDAQAATGARLAQAQTQADALDNAKLLAQTRISALEDVDVESAVSKLKQKLTSIDAAQAAFARIADLSLFNYLK